MSNMKSGHVHIGARELDPKNVKRILPNIENIENIINTFRENATRYLEAKDDSSAKNVEMSKEQYDNVISVLGNRGTGKTSTMLTIISEIKKGTFFKDNKVIDMNKYDLFSDLIAPEDMSENSNILGWIIVVLENFYLEMKEIISKSYIPHEIDSQNEIEDLFISVKSAYQYRKRESNRIISDNFSNMDDFARTKIKIEENDLNLVPLFFRIIDLLIHIKRRINQHINVGYNKIPLIFFCFDDVDVDTKHSVSILRDIITFLSHPNIVVLVSGDYKIFSQTATLNMLEVEKISNNELNQCFIYGTDSSFVENTAIELAKSRSEFLLRKVLPPLYRFELKPLSNEDKAKITYISPQQGESFLECNNIVELISKLYNISDAENKNFLYISKQSFESSGIWSMKLEPDNDESSSKFFQDEMKLLFSDWEFSNEKENHIVYPYLSIFSSSIRGFMNVYNFLYNMVVLKNQIVSEKESDGFVYNLRFLNELLKIIIQSKSTFLRYQNEINKYIRIENYDDGSDDLVIDCEELKIFMENNFHPSTQKDIKAFESLIFLPIFFNELAELTFSCGRRKDEYKERYESVQLKLQEIFSKIFLRKINPMLSSNPQTLTRKITYILYHRVTTRMSINALSALLSYRDEAHDLESKVSIRNDKKYFVQLFQCFLLFYEVNYFVKNESSDNEEYYVLLQMDDVIENDEKNEASQKLLVDDANMKCLGLLINISQLSSHLLRLDKKIQRNKFKVCTIDGEVYQKNKFTLHTINGEEYRKVIVNDKNKRAIYESIIFFYLCVKFNKKDYTWISQFKTQLKSCVNNFDYTDPIRRRLFPVQLFIREEIWPIYEIVENFNNNYQNNRNISQKINNKLLSARKEVKNIYSMLDVRLIFDESIRKQLKKTFSTAFVKWCNNSKKVRLKEFQKCLISEHLILEDQDVIFVNIKQILKWQDKIESQIRLFSDNTNDKQKFRDESKINDGLLNLIQVTFKELTQLYSKFTSDRYTDQLSDIVYQLYSIISDNLKINLSVIEDVIYDQFYQFVRRLLLDASVDGVELVVNEIVKYMKTITTSTPEEIYEITKGEMRRYLLKQVRILRLNEGYDEATMLKLINMYISLIPIYVMARYLSCFEVDNSTKNDHEFFYRLSMVLINYEQFNIID